MSAAATIVAPVASPVYWDRKNQASFAGISAGDTVQIWNDGDIKPWTGTVDGASEIKGLASVFGPKGGERGYVRNIHSGTWYAIVGTKSHKVARVVKV